MACVFSIPSPAQGRVLATPLRLLFTPAFDSQQLGAPALLRALPPQRDGGPRRDSALPSNVAGPGGAGSLPPGGKAGSLAPCTSVALWSRRVVTTAAVTGCYGVLLATCDPCRRFPPSGGQASRAEVKCFILPSGVRKNSGYQNRICLGKFPWKWGQGPSRGDLMSFSFFPLMPALLEPSSCRFVLEIGQGASAREGHFLFSSTSRIFRIPAHTPPCCAPARHR
ncbi:uncharacterized protein LOC118603915 [Rousettus aegyptiacus]|uniref:uncharacterized protein LOC118603915 n=1 Tax=Rousettus aegyptiacus TaxID=9407 RepID=UPI00168D5AE4|nr:uncharacterized protein LOC118603915 [Rousettus aegyptiacus]